MTRDTIFKIKEGGYMTGTFLISLVVRLEAEGAIFEQ